MNWESIIENQGQWWPVEGRNKIEDRSKGGRRRVNIINIKKDLVVVNTINIR